MDVFRSRKQSVIWSVGSSACQSWQFHAAQSYSWQSYSVSAWPKLRTRRHFGKFLRTVVLSHLLGSRQLERVIWKTLQSDQEERFFPCNFVQIGGDLWTVLKHSIIYTEKILYTLTGKLGLVTVITKTFISPCHNKNTEGSGDAFG